MSALEQLDVVTAEELAEHWKVSPDWIYKHAASGAIPSFKMGANRRFRLADALAYMEQCREGPGAEVVDLPTRAREA